MAAEANPALQADRGAQKRALRPRGPSSPSADGSLNVERKLEARWSPEQISAWLAETYPDDLEMQVSHETIYQSLFVQGRGARERSCTAACERVGPCESQGVHEGRNRPGQLTNMVMISERPAEVANRAVPGHWEGDLIFGRKMTDIGTLVERQSRYVILLKLPNGHGAESGSQGNDQADPHAAGPAPRYGVPPTWAEPTRHRHLQRGPCSRRSRRSRTVRLARTSQHKMATPDRIAGTGWSSSREAPTAHPKAVRFATTS